MRYLLIVTIGLITAACSDEKPAVRPDGGNGTTDRGMPTEGGPPPGKELTFVKESIDVEKAGEYTAIAASGTRIGVAYYRALSQDAWPQIECPSTFGQPGATKARPAHDLYYAESKDGGKTWGTPVKVDRTINAPFGVSVAIGADGQVHIGFLGGTEISKQECASSDAAIASSADGTAWSTRTLFVAGPVGDTVGHWMSVAVDPQNQAHGAYRDVGFGLYEAIGHEKSDLRYDDGEAIDEDLGSGMYATLKFTSEGLPAIMHFNAMQKDQSGGIQVAVKRSGVWETNRAVPGGTIERPDFDTDGKGVWGIAFHEPSARSLKYTESTDLKSWSTPLTVDLTPTVNGGHSSLAFDSQGNPAISYRRCGPATVQPSKCDLSADALMFAYRIDGKWKTWEVDTGGEFACGDQTSLAFNEKDEPLISYRCVMLRNADNEFVDTLKVARGIWK